MRRESRPPRPVDQPRSPGQTPAPSAGERLPSEALSQSLARIASDRPPEAIAEGTIEGGDVGEGPTPSSPLGPLRPDGTRRHPSFLCPRVFLWLPDRWWPVLTR